MAEYIENLWHVFNLRELNKDQGGYILYCLRYDDARMMAHRDSVISALKANGTELESIGDRIGVITKKSINESEKKITMTLLEELSILNGALEYSRGGFRKFKSIQEMRNGLLSTYFNWLADNNQAGAYRVVSEIIPEICVDIGKACLQNKNIISKRDKKTLNELLAFSKRHVKLHSNPKGFVIYNT